MFTSSVHENFKCLTLFTQFNGFSKDNTYFYISWVNQQHMEKKVKASVLIKTGILLGYLGNILYCSYAV